jgi:hypothetical protein
MLVPVRTSVPKVPASLFLAEGSDVSSDTVAQFFDASAAESLDTRCTPTQRLALAPRGLSMS